MDHTGVQLRLLGEVRVRCDGEHHHVGAGRRAAVLVVLALGGVASLEQIVTAVWGDDPPTSANGNVYTHINALREVLGDGMLTRADGVYRLRVTAREVDALRFEALREQAGRHRMAGDLVAELAVLQEGLTLWSGAALSGVPGPFAEAERVRLHELRLASEQRQAEVLLDLGRHAAAIRLLRSVIAAHPLQESMYRLLMIALHAVGQPDEALRVFDELKAVLIRNTGTEPTAELRRTRNHIATGSTRQVLRAFAFIGDGATLDEACQVTGLPRATVEHEVALGRAGGVLTTTSGTVRFRDPAVAHALYGRTPEAVRATLHAFFAEMIADACGPAERVAAQLLRTDPAPLTPKASRWLLEHIDQLASQSPADAITLLQRAHLQHLSDQETHVALSVWLARLLFGQGRDAVTEAGWVAARIGDLEVQAEMLWIAACSHDGQGHHDDAAEIARSILSARRHAQPWLDRFRNLILRLRTSLPGEATEPRHGRAAVVSAAAMAAFRRANAADEAR